MKRRVIAESLTADFPRGPLTIGSIQANVIESRRCASGGFEIKLESESFAPCMS